MLCAAKEETPALPVIWGESVLPLAADPALLENRIWGKSLVAENSRQGFELRSSTLRWASSEVKSRTALGMRGTLYDEGIRSRCNGKERDSESGLDNFGARYDASALGRFMTPDWATKPTDVPYANFGNPQSLNLYIYVKNNPTTFGDPDGHCCDLSDLNTFASAALNALVSDNLAGYARQDQTTSVGKVGAAVGDAVATVQGGAEALFGGGVEVGGVALDATGVGAVVGVPANVAGAGIMLHGGATAATGFSNLFKSATSDTGSSSTESSADTTRAARREAMRQEGIPTSQQPKEGGQISTEAGRQYTYEVPKAGGGTETKIVTNQLKDANHGPHVEAGAPKANGQTDPSGRLRHANRKTKVNVNQ